jgi:hypothetical protein
VKEYRDSSYDTISASIVCRITWNSSRIAVRLNPTLFLAENNEPKYACCEFIFWPSGFPETHVF